MNRSKRLVTCLLAATLFAVDVDAVSLARVSADSGVYQQAIERGASAEEALVALKRAAENGDADAQLDLAERYAEGDGVEKDAFEAVKWWRKAAEQGLARAQYYLGVCYDNGDGVDKDAAEAVRWWRKAADQGLTEAQYYLGVYYGKSVDKDSVEAARFFRSAAEQGFAEAQYYLGLCYDHGKGVEKDSAEAVKWFRKAAEQGLAKAQYNLGLCYDNGKGVEKDSAEAVEWYRQAAEQGLADAQNKLGFCYAYSVAHTFCVKYEGVEKDPVEAVKWWRRAAEQGLADAQFNLGCCYFDGDGIAPSNVEAVKWWSRAAEQGLAKAQRNLAMCYWSGSGVKTDNAESVKWLRLAALGGASDDSNFNILRKTQPRSVIQKGIQAAEAWLARREKPKSPPVLLVKATFEEPSGNRALDADENARLRIIVQNKGKGASRQLRARVSLKSTVRGLDVPADIIIGDIEPGAERAIVLPLKGQRTLVAGKPTIEVALTDKYGFDAPLIRQSFETRAFVPPRFAITLGVDDGNGNGLVERGEELALSLIVKNQGGAARGVKLSLNGPEGLIWLGQGESVTLGDIPAGGWKRANFSCLVRNQYAGPNVLALGAVINEARPDLGGKFPVALTLNQAAPRVLDQVAKAAAETTAQIPAPELNDPVDRAPARNTQQPDAHAVIIGVERYASSLVPAVTFAKRDATVVKEYMVKTLGVPVENVHLVIDHDATLAKLRTVISGQLANAVESGKSSVYVYFAGHGVPNSRTKTPYLVPYDGNPAYPDTSCYPLTEFYQSLGKLEVPVTVWLDACFSGGVGRVDSPQTLLADARPALVELKNTSTPPNVTVLAAANGEQISSSYAAKKHGLFTYFLLKGLAGEADADKNQRLTHGELHQYVTPLVKKQARSLNRDQTPTLQGSAESTVY